MSRERAIEKIEAWARWEMKIKREGEGTPSTRNQGDIPGDQADNLTVELALKEFKGPHLRGLLLHVYGKHLFIDTYDVAQLIAPEHRGPLRALMIGFGESLEAYARRRTHKFVRFLVERLSTGVAA